VIPAALAWMKALHVAAVAIWAAGLLALPGLYRRRAAAGPGPPLERLQRLVRFLYVAVISPAAFVAVASGTALIFLAQTFAPWFVLKLVLVGGLAATHVLTGLVILRLFGEGQTYPVRRVLAVTGLTASLGLAVLAVVLAKPDLPDLLPDALSRPGALGDLLGDLRASLNPSR